MPKVNKALKTAPPPTCGYCKFLMECYPNLSAKAAREHCPSCTPKAMDNLPRYLLPRLQYNALCESELAHNQQLFVGLNPPVVKKAPVQPRPAPVSIAPVQKAPGSVAKEAPTPPPAKEKAPRSDGAKRWQDIPTAGLIRWMGMEKLPFDKVRGAIAALGLADVSDWTLKSSYNNGARGIEKYGTIPKLTADQAKRIKALFK